MKGNTMLVGFLALFVIAVMLFSSESVVPGTIWLRDAPGTMYAGTPDRISFPSYPARTYSLDAGDGITVYGSFYAWGTEEMCERVGGTIKTSGANVGTCLLNEALVNLDYILDGQGNTYTSFRIIGNDIHITQNFGYVPQSMTWYMTTSVPAVEPPDDPYVPPVIEPPSDDLNGDDPYVPPEEPEPINIIQYIILIMQDFFNTIRSWFV